jgi:hypothetical protein
MVPKLQIEELTGSVHEKPECSCNSDVYVGNSFDFLNRQI